jgi:hypothetical protein
MSPAQHKPSWLTRVAWTASALVLFLGVATLRAVLDGEREIAASDAAFDANDLHASIQHARRAASAYAPRAPHVERGYERLLAIARGSEAAGHADIALLAWQAQRAAVLESQSVLRPFSERLEEANRNLARLQAAKTAAEADRAELAQRLFRHAQTRQARAPWGALLSVGLLVAAGGLAWFAAAGVAADGRISWRRGAWGMAIVALGAALWAAAAFHG